MAKQSGYLQRWENETNRLLQATMAITSQYDIDTLQIAIHQTEGWGYDRIMRLTEAWAEVRKEYRPALDYKTRRRTCVRSTWIGCWRRLSGTRRS